MSRLINRPCSLIYRFDEGDTDEAGDVVYAEETVESVCEIQHSSSQEAATGAPASSEWVGFFLDDVELEAVDAVSVPDLGAFEVVGPPASWRSPLSRRESYVQAELARVGEAEEEGS